MGWIGGMCVHVEHGDGTEGMTKSRINDGTTVMRWYMIIIIIEGEGSTQATYCSISGRVVTSYTRC